MSEPPPNMEYCHTTCPVCGATTEAEAGARCQTGSDETGERYCRGGVEIICGQVMLPTASSIAALDEWCDRNAQPDQSPDKP